MLPLLVLADSFLSFSVSAFCSSLLTKNFENLAKKFSVGKISAEEYSSALQKLADDSLNNANLKTVRLTNLNEELARSFKEISSPMKGYSEDFKKSVESFLGEARKSIQGTKSAYESFKESFNVDEIREKLDALGGNGVNVRALRRDADDLTKTFRTNFNKDFAEN